MKHTIKKIIFLAGLFACASHTFSATAGSRLFANAQAQAVTLMAVTLPYVVTGVMTYLNCPNPVQEPVNPEPVIPKTPETAKKPANFDTRNIPPTKVYVGFTYVGFIKCTTKDTYMDCGILKYQIEPIDYKKTDQNIIYIKRIDVPKKYRRQGIATQMLQEVSTYAQAQNIDTLELVSINKGATVCYKSCGFEKRNASHPNDYCFMVKDISKTK